MKRFYDKAVLSLSSEARKDIESYVHHLEHERNVLINELSECGGLRAKHLLSRLGFAFKTTQARNIAQSTDVTQQTIDCFVEAATKKYSRGEDGQV